MPKTTRITKTLHRCERCKTKYFNKKECKACEKMPVEARAFRKGDTVKCLHNWECSCCNKWYPAVGKVVKVLGPEPWDESYELTVARSPGRFRVHTYFYHVEAPCPKCGHVRRPGGVGPEFTLVARRKKAQ